MMTWGARWRNALLVSVLSHLFFLIMIGYLAGKLLTIPPLPEQYIALETANTIGSEPLGNVAPGSETNSIALPAPASPAVEPSQPQPVVSSAEALSDPIPAVTEPIQQPVANSTAESRLTGRAGSSGGNNGVAVNDGNGVKAGSGSGGGSGSGLGNIVPPRVLTRIEAIYPQSAQQTQLQGTVLLKVQILETGIAGAISVLNSSGHAILDAAAITAVEQWRFVPAKDRSTGRTIACYSTLPVSFRLK